MVRFIQRWILLLAAFLVCYLGLFAVLCQVRIGSAPAIFRISETLRLKGGNSWRKFREFDASQRYAVIFMGSSHAYRGYDPGLFAARGHTAFNLGSSAQSPLNSYHLLRYHLTPANTGLLVLDVYELAMEIDGLESASDLIANMVSDRAAMDMAMALRDPRAVNMLTLRIMRANEPPDIAPDSTYLPGGTTLRPDSVKGDVRYDRGKPMRIHPRQRHFLRKILAHCQRTGIPVVLVNHPYPSAADRAKHDAFNAFLREEADPFGVPYIDMAFDHGLPIHDRHHFYDHNHLNRAGVEIFNAALIERLERERLLVRAPGSGHPHRP